MKTQKIISIVIGVALVVATIYFWPQYQKQIPVTKSEAVKIAAEQVSQIPAEAPLDLIVQPDDGMGVLEDAIRHASKTVDLVIYELDDSTIEQLLVDAKNRGIKVRVILQNISNFGRRPNQKAYDFLQSHGVPVIWAQKYFALTHQKTLIVDGQKAFVMTFNLMSKYYASSRDFGLVLHDLKDIIAIEAAFDSDWKGDRAMADNGNDLVWSPGSADTILALINSATTSLDIYALEMDAPDITSALEAATKRGVATRVNMTYATTWKTVLSQLVSAGVAVRTYPSTAKFFIHAKVIIADGKKAFLGSENFSTQSLNLNRELGVLIANPDIIISLENTFETDWAGSRPFTPSVAVDSSTQTIIKLSKTGICHSPGDASYNQTKNFTGYATVQDCLSTGGKLPVSAKK